MMQVCCALMEILPFSGLSWMLVKAYLTCAKTLEVGENWTIWWRNVGSEALRTLKGVLQTENIHDNWCRRD